MKKTITLGEGFKIDLPKFIDTRALFAANSGGGKSWALRKLLEETHGEVQQIVIDLEGEFYTLREKFDDYLLIGKGGDMPADVRAAALLATKLLDLGVSAIVDLSELKFHERKHFVRLFLESLIEAPEELRHPCMVVLDEAHHFCPQVGESEAAAAVIDLMTRGRKRELCGVLATQRISKLHKDAIAECNNKFFGRTGQDIDVKRTADELGFAKSAREAFETLRNLSPGEFFAFGTAISGHVERYKIGAVQTTHFRKGSKQGRKATPPKAAIKSILSQLKDLPQEAEQKKKTEVELRQEIGTLKAKITGLEKQGGKPTAAQIEEALHPHLIAIASERNAVKSLVSEKNEYAKNIISMVRHLALSLLKQLDELEKNRPSDKPAGMYSGKVPELKDSGRKILGFPVITDNKMPKGSAVMRTEKQKVEISFGEFNPSASQQKILNALAWLEQIGLTPANKNQLAFLSDQSSTSSGYQNNLGALRSAGMIIYPSSKMVGITDAGRAVAQPDDAPSSSLDLHRQIEKKLSSSQWAILKVLIGIYPEEVPKGDLAEQAGQSPNSSGYQNNLGALRTLGLIEYPRSGMVVALPTLFLEK